MPDLRREWQSHPRSTISCGCSSYIDQQLGIAIDPESMFDVLVKRLHEYKRQHLQVLHILTLYQRMQRDPQLEIVAAHLHLRG